MDSLNEVFSIGVRVRFLRSFKSGPQLAAALHPVREVRRCAKHVALVEVAGAMCRGKSGSEPSSVRLKVEQG